MKQMVLELPDQLAPDPLLHALDGYKARLRMAIEASTSALRTLEERYGLTTAEFLAGSTAEDLVGRDQEYVEWAGEAQMLQRLKAELAGLDEVRCAVR